MVLSGGQSPGARRRRPRPPRGAPAPSLPRTGSPCGPGPPPAFTRSPGTGGWGSFVFFVATAAAGTVCALRWPPPSAFPEPGLWGRHVGTGPGRRRRCALTCRRCCCGGEGGRCGGGTAGQPWPCSPPPPPPLSLAAAAAAAAVGVSGAAAAGLFLSGYVKVT
ncbi:unnamed protein product [Rangifer tarandus platyrhynchus]|uniref:Uncharacterized protein n=1 Tax=Rangifer tarandus platyrhynchus TaxID=3082113 RepID=A0ACB1MJD6_RANTA